MGVRVKDELVPQELLEPGFEARYVGSTDIEAFKSDGCSSGPTTN